MSGLLELRKSTRGGCLPVTSVAHLAANGVSRLELSCVAHSGELSAKASSTIVSGLTAHITSRGNRWWRLSADRGKQSNTEQDEKLERGH